MISFALPVVLAAIVGVLLYTLGTPWWATLIGVGLGVWSGISLTMRHNDLDLPADHELTHDRWGMRKK